MIMNFYDTRIGKIVIVEENDQIIKLLFGTKQCPVSEVEIKESPLLRDAAHQLELYLDGKLREFSLPLAPVGTEFQMRVWCALLEVPYGKTASYKEIAEAIGSPKAVRAVGGANNKNPISIFIPCHRIINANGELGGYGGGLEVKRKLLKLEGCVLREK